MTAKINVTLKKSIMDPQGTAVKDAALSMGFDAVDDVRIGKHIELKIKDGVSREEAEKQIELLCQKLLANPVMENFSFEITED